MCLVRSMWLLYSRTLCNCHVTTSPKVARGRQDPAHVCRLGCDSERTVKCKLEGKQANCFPEMEKEERQRDLLNFLKPLGSQTPK